MTYKEYIEDLRNNWIGKVIKYDGCDYNVLDVDYNGMLIIDKRAEFTNTTAIDPVSVNDVKEA